ncbi:MAG: beta-lactamase family protein, partial [Oscillospiraceae bacterium]|nr:beta-lactamase family protein [Oscillospiraceae bacterium]
MNFSNLRNCMDMFLERDHVPGLHCKVYKNHEEVFDYRAGMSDLETQKPMQGNEIYKCYSMTKMITCISALQLMEKNKFLLNDQVSMYLPEFEMLMVAETENSGNELETVATGVGGATFTETENVRIAKVPLTVRHLFTMSSGLDYNRRPPAILAAINEGRTSTRELAGELSKTVL